MNPSQKKRKQEAEQICDGQRLKAKRHSTCGEQLHRSKGVWSLPASVAVLSAQLFAVCNFTTRGRHTLHTVALSPGLEGCGR